MAIDTFDSLEASRQDVLSMLQATLQAAGMPEISFVLRQSKDKLDVVEIYGFKVKPMKNIYRKGAQTSTGNSAVDIAQRAQAILDEGGLP